MAVPHLELARDPTRGAERQPLLDPFDIGEEEDEFDVAGVVLDQNLERTLAVARRRPVLGDAHLQRRDGVATGVADFRARAPVDRGDRQMEQYVEHPRARAADRAICRTAWRSSARRPAGRSRGRTGGREWRDACEVYTRTGRGPRARAFAQALEIPLSMMRVFRACPVPDRRLLRGSPRGLIHGLMTACNSLVLQRKAHENIRREFVSLTDREPRRDNSRSKNPRSAPPA